MDNRDAGSQVNENGRRVLIMADKVIIYGKAG
jgi:hypothetical protein